MLLIYLFILWTWGLTPLWVNITSTVIIGLQILINFLKEYYPEATLNVIVKNEDDFLIFSFLFIVYTLDRFVDTYNVIAINMFKYEK